MPKKQYESVTNQVLLKNIIQSDMVEAVSIERKDWENGFAKTTDHAEKKQEAVLQYLGADLTDEQFVALENKLKEE